MMTITDEMLYEAAPLAAELYLGTLPGREDCEHTFPPEFEAKMRPLLAGKRRRRHWKRLLVLAAVIAALTVGGVSVYAERGSVYQMDWTQEDGFISYHVRAERDVLGQFHRMEPGYLPTGYTLQEEKTEKQSCSAYSYYKDEAGNSLIVHQAVQERKSGIILDVIQAERVHIGEQEGMLVQYDGGRSSLLWVDGPNILELNCTSLTEEEVLKIAEHMNYQGGKQK